MFFSGNTTPDDDVQPLDKRIMSVLYKHTIIDENLIFGINKFVHELLAHRCIFERHKEYILAPGIEKDMNKRLIEVMTRRSVADYKVFVKCLAEHQSDGLAELLAIDNTGTSGKQTISIVWHCCI